MRKITSLLLIALLVSSCGSKDVNGDPEEEKVFPLGFDTQAYFCDSTSVQSGETFTSIMARLGMSSEDTYTLCGMCDTVFNVRKVIAGNKIEAYYSKDSVNRVLEYAVYHRNTIQSTIFKCRDSLAAYNYSKPVEHERRYADVIIKSSLWNDMKAAGASPALIMDLADILQWSVNLFTLQENDRFRVIYDQTVSEGEVLAIDSVSFCIFTSGNAEVSAARFHKDGKSAYWGKDGESLRRMFLKAPLRYNRISSGFTYHRRHPITGRVRAHTAVDYAAPKGTPVHSIGDGRVILCGWDGSGGGNRIKIRHQQGYESSYMHLSGFAKGIKAGSVVSQGQLIGYVGSTGHSTGPHLDFRIWLKGKPINPLSLNSPACEPLPSKYMEEFNAVYSRFMAEMDSLQLAKLQKP